jgi:hypothetical protein
MRKTVTQYTIFTCDCCGREQEDRAYQEHLVSGSDKESSAEPVNAYPATWRTPGVHFQHWQTENSLEVCSECAQRIHDAIREVIRKASAENVQEQLAMIERSKA